MLINERAQARSRIAEYFRLEENLCVAEEDSEALGVVLAHIDDWTVERASLTVGTERPKVEADTLAVRIGELEVGEPSCDGELAFSYGPCGR